MMHKGNDPSRPSVQVITSSQDAASAIALEAAAAASPQVQLSAKALEALLQSQECRVRGERVQA